MSPDLALGKGTTEKSCLFQGPNGCLAGTRSDGSSMTLCAPVSLTQCGGFDETWWSGLRNGHSVGI